jgi:hypothetical protein
VTIRVENRIRNEDIAIVSVEVTGKNALGREVKKSFTVDDIEMPEEYGGVIPRRERADIKIKRLTIMKSVSDVTVYSDVCRF